MGGLESVLCGCVVAYVSARQSVINLKSPLLNKTRNFVYIGIFAFVDLAFILISAAYFALADGNDAGSAALLKAGGAFVRPTIGCSFEQTYANGA